MSEDDALYKEFLSEMESLEKFRVTYSGLFPNASLQREDQDVRRIVEALGMFNAKTRVAGRRALLRSTVRLFSQHFPQMLNSIPAMTMLSAVANQKFVDASFVPKGTRVFISGEGKENGPMSGENVVAHFRTLSHLNVVPYRLDWVEILRIPGEGYRLLLRIESDFSRNDEIGDLSFHINHLNDLNSSSLINFNLKKHIQRIGVVFDEEVNQGTQSEECDFYFGPVKGQDVSGIAFDHPLQRARTFFRFPQQDLFLTVNVAARSRNWEFFTLALDLGPDWPTNLRLSPSSLQLNVAPMANIEKALSNPVMIDGTKERVLLGSSEPENRFVPQAIQTVYRLDGEGLQPLNPGVVDYDSGHATYEVESEGALENRKVWGYIHIPGSFESPVPVAAEGVWHQPLLAEEPLGQWETVLADRHVEGVSWEVTGPVLAAAESDFINDYDGLMQLLSIKNQRFLSVNDLAFVLRALGASSSQFFSEIAAAIVDLQFEKKPFVKNSTGFKYIYHLELSALDSGLIGIIDLFGKRLLEILKSWSVEEVVELTISVRNMETQLSYS